MGEVFSLGLKSLNLFIIVLCCNHHLYKWVVYIVILLIVCNIHIMY